MQYADRRTRLLKICNSIRNKAIQKRKIEQSPISAQKMSLLTQKDHRSILKLLQKLHTPCNSETFPTHILSLLPQAVTSEVWFYYEMNFQSKFLSILSPSVSRQFIEHIKQISFKYFDEHPIVAYYMKTWDGKARKISDFLSDIQLHNLEGMYWQYLHPISMEDQMGFAIPSHTHNKCRPMSYWNQNHVGITLHRPERSFSERDRLVLNILRPHLLQAYQNAQAVTQIQQELAKLNQVLEQSNTIVLTADGKVDLMSQRASALLKYYFQLPSLPSFRLPEPLHQWVKSQISRLTQTTDIPSPCLPLRLEWQDKQLLIRLIADQPGEQYLLLLEEQPQHTLSPESVELLGLTKREAEVLCWVAQGKTNMEIAAIFSNSEHTVKKHLEHIYQKFGIQGRTAAVTYALNKLGMIRGDL
ncbi:hypothetical protein J5X98_00185 [Leptothermofonsia sichuanensis E412]|uniref:response regulator transcription factor n=1 Tax=Leptothermofonsia sichuanensis TaxID=2917832 RepID=UPI001CA7959D|nr:helix-turn-helix transcriptional regulator [Leptothermofonsia sichuanensis]QZZ20975.1 hypothetical protein J5X98_00185 [Leptothermofonsia sichuanensis E412]